MVAARLGGALWLLLNVLSSVVGLPAGLPAGWPAGSPAAAQDLALTKDCEDGFRRFIHMAESGQLGPDVSAANIGVMKDRVRLELVRPGQMNKRFVLTPKRSAHTVSRYFDIAPGDGATPSDVERVGKMLDKVFGQSPFQLPGLEESLRAVPGFAEAWAIGGWAGVVQTSERRVMALASLNYTIGVVVLLVLATLASLVLLWGSTPPRSSE